jgi:hypothetical protein
LHCNTCLAIESLADSAVCAIVAYPETGDTFDLSLCNGRFVEQPCQVSKGSGHQVYDDMESKGLRQAKIYSCL